MTVVNPWSLVLPSARAEQVVATLAYAFRELADAPTPDVCFDDEESAISKRLTCHLQTQLSVTLMSGFWDFEVCTVNPNMGDPRRLDITYSTVVKDKYNVRLIFECKKLFGITGRRAKEYGRRYLHEGVRRFVTGSYAPNERIAFMVGFVDAKGGGAVRATADLMVKGKALDELRPSAYGDCRYYEAPPRVFAKHAVMETHHQRTWPLPEITLYHLELRFPAESKPRTR